MVTSIPIRKQHKILFELLYFMLHTFRKLVKCCGYLAHFKVQKKKTLKPNLLLSTAEIYYN